MRPRVGNCACKGPRRAGIAAKRRNWVGVLVLMDGVWGHFLGAADHSYDPRSSLQLRFRRLFDRPPHHEINGLRYAGREPAFS